MDVRCGSGSVAVKLKDDTLKSTSTNIRSLFVFTNKANILFLCTLKGFGTSKLPLYPKVNLGLGMPPGNWFWKYVGCGILYEKNQQVHMLR